jgi:hypothetical protein
MQEFYLPNLNLELFLRKLNISERIHLLAYSFFRRLLNLKTVYFRNLRRKELAA